MFVFLKYLFFLKIWPADTIASLLAIPRLSVLLTIKSRKYKDLYPDIARTLKSDLLIFK